jgi:hypothetical protein
VPGPMYGYVHDGGADECDSMESTSFEVGMVCDDEICEDDLIYTQNEPIKYLSQ